MQDIRDRVAIVTGGASGIGLGIARALIEDGAVVEIVARFPRLDKKIAVLESIVECDL